LADIGDQVFLGEMEEQNSHAIFYPDTNKIRVIYFRSGFKVKVIDIEPVIMCIGWVEHVLVC
jgi:hypothetical protein